MTIATAEIKETNMELEEFSFDDFVVPDMFEHEKFKIEALKQMVSQARNDIANGNLADGEIFMQELLDGRYD